MDTTGSPPPYVSWKKTFELGLPDIDLEHETFFDIINRLYAAMTRGGSAGYLQAVRERLEQYAAYHFTGEEEFLEAVGYPGLAGHQKEHAWFVKSIHDLRLGSRVHGSSALALAREWLVRHILGTDKAYATWLAEQRPSRPVEFRRAS